MRVVLYRNYREARQPSMRLYADMLARHLGRVAGIEVEEVRPRVLPSLLDAWPATAKLGDFAGRYLLYPLSVSPRRDVVHHLVDHGNAHLRWRLGDRSLVATCHDLIPLLADRGRLPRGFAPPGARTIFRILARALARVPVILAVSESTRADLLRELDRSPESVRVVPLGIHDELRITPSDTALLAAEERLQLGAHPRILSVGVDLPYKNLAGVLRAFARIRRQAPRATLIRVGAPLSGEHRALAASLGIAPAVHELGHVSAPDLGAVYRLADVLLFPSWYEGFGWPPLEAMACGLPVVASPRGAIPEVAGEAPLYAPPDDPEHLAEQALRLCADASLRAARIRAGREWSAGFTWERTARETAAVYRSLGGP